MENTKDLYMGYNENRNRIFHCIRKNGSISRPAIARELELSLPTTTIYLQELEDGGFIYRNGSVGNTGGRRAVAYSIVKDNRIAVGVDLTEKWVQVATVDMNGEIICCEEMECDFDNCQAYWEHLAYFIDRIVKSSSNDYTRVLGVGIATQSIVSADYRRIHYVKTMDMQEVTADYLEQYIPYQCYLFNDANAAGYGEVARRKNQKNLFYISLSDNVGGSILIDNKPFQGQMPKSGEIGHVVIHPNGKQCYCGQKGCLDAYCSASVLRRNMKTSIREFFEGLEKGDEKYKAYWEEYLEALAIAIVDVRNLFDCDIVLGGYIGSKMEAYLPKIRDMVAARNPFEDQSEFLSTCIIRDMALSYGSGLFLIHRCWQEM